MRGFLFGMMVLFVIALSGCGASGTTATGTGGAGTGGSTGVTGSGG